MGSIVWFIAALIPTGAITFGLVAIFSRLSWRGLQWVLVANVLAAGIAVCLATIAADGNLNAGLNYLAPQALILVVSILRWKGQASRARSASARAG